MSHEARGDAALFIVGSHVPASLRTLKILHDRLFVAILYDTYISPLN